MKLFIVAGEASGDAHAALLVDGLRKQMPGMQIHALGGAALASRGVPLLADLAGMSVVGGMEVLRKYRLLRGIFDNAVRFLDENRPDAVLLVDYPGFNLRFAEEAKKRGIRVIYYVSPQIWAWGAKRIHKIKRLVDLMLVILPFEQALYEKAGVPVRYVGHPSLDRAQAVPDKDACLKSLGLEPGSHCVALLPGSRAMEVQKLFPVLLDAAQRIAREMPETHFLIPCAADYLKPALQAMLAGKPAGLKAHVLDGQAMQAAKAADMALVASGTATLETAMMGCPMFIVYKVNWLTYAVGRMLVKVPFLGLVNILAGECVAPEFLQGMARADLIARQALAWLKSPQELASRRAKLRSLCKGLGGPGASQSAAQSVAAFMGEPQQERLSA